MTNFEKITASPEALAEFLASLNVADSPWDAAFHKKFCADCWQENCDAEPCPHQRERNNPTWWLVQKIGAAHAKEKQGRLEDEKTDDASERESLIRQYEKRLEKLKAGASPAKGKDILSKAEDVILQGVERMLKAPEKMTGEDCRNLQTLVCTAGRIQAIRSGNFHSNYPD